MVKMISGCKTKGEIAVNDINLELSIGKSMIITGKNSEKNSLLIEMLSGLFHLDSGEYTYNDKPIQNLTDDFFYFSRHNLKVGFEKVVDLVHHYALYYDKFNFKLVSEMLNSINMKTDNKLSSLTHSEINYVYFSIGICSNASYLFLDNILEDVEKNLKNKIQYTIEKHNNNRCFVMTCRDLNDYDDIVTHIGIFKNELKIYPKTFLDDFSKFNISYYEPIDLEDFKKYNLIYIRPVDHTAIVIANNNQSTKHFFLDSNPTSFTKIKMNLEDIFYCLNDKYYLDEHPILGEIVV